MGFHSAVLGCHDYIHMVCTSGAVAGEAAMAKNDLAGATTRSGPPQTAGAGSLPRPPAGVLSAGVGTAGVSRPAAGAVVARHHPAVPCQGRSLSGCDTA